MKSLERLSIKVFVFVLISGLINYYVLTMLFRLFNTEKGALFYVIWIVGSLAYLFCAELLMHFSSDFIKGISIVFSAWFGIVLTFLWTFGVYELLNLFFVIPFKIAGYAVIAIVFVLVIYSLYNASTFNVRTIRLESEKLKKPLKIVQLSDIHIGATHRKDFLPKTIERVNALNPDFVVITGDLIDGMHHYNDDEFLCLNNLHAPAFFVLGNHEQFIDIERVYALLEKTHLRFLRNVSIVQDGIQIIGIDDTSSKKEFLKNFKSVPIDINKFTLLLYHRPGMFKEVSKEDVDLMLSGHTHGGQLFPLNILLYIIDGPVSGLHKRNNTYIYVSNGTGWWGPPMRLGSRNEITVINLIPLRKQEDECPTLMDANETNNIHLQASTEVAEIISLKRGKKGLKDKHSEVLFPVDKLISAEEKDVKISAKKPVKLSSKAVKTKIKSNKIKNIKKAKKPLNKKRR
ncbi:MAG: metallophosphoesterase [Candidatus Nanoarchaeia archaeon]